MKKIGGGGELLLQFTALRQMVGFLNKPGGVAGGRPWVDIDKNRDLFLELVKFKVGRGSKIQFWEDAWATDVCSTQVPLSLCLIFKKGGFGFRLPVGFCKCLGFGVKEAPLIESFLDGPVL